MFCEVKGSFKSKRDITLEAAYFAKNFLIPRVKKLEVYIFLVDMENDADVIEEDSREFYIRVKKSLNKEDLVTAIFHEFVHIKQSIRKEYGDIFAISNIPYYDKPSEKEAYKLQEVILAEYMKSINSCISL